MSERKFWLVFWVGLFCALSALLLAPGVSSAMLAREIAANGGAR